MIDCTIDVSDNNDKIDWRRVAAAGITVVMIKALHGTASGYPSFEAQRSGARGVGIAVVPYWFLTGAVTLMNAATFARLARLGPGVPFAIDWEGRASQTAPAKTVEACGAALAKIAGRPPLGYWGMAGSTPSEPSAAMSGWDRWVPRYPQVPQPTAFAEMNADAVAKRPPGALFWQYTSAGHVDGITGRVDRSVWCGTAEELAAWLAKGK